MKKFFRKNKKVLTIVGVILVTTLIVGFVAASTNIIGKISNSNIGGLRERNFRNLLTVEKYQSLHGTDQNGVFVKIDEDGVIILNGTATADVSFTLCSDYHIDAKKYVMVSGLVDGSIDTCYLRAHRYNTVNYAFQFDDPLILDANKDGLYLELMIAKGATFNNYKVYPVIAADGVINYYAN